MLGLADERLGNPDLKWESTTMFNVGLDISFMQNKLNLTADYFHNETEDLLLFVSIPASLGFENILKNSGSLTNKGFELGLNYVVMDSKDFRWEVSGNLSVLRNEITDLGGSAPFFSTSTSGHLGVDGSWATRSGYGGGTGLQGFFKARKRSTPTPPGRETGQDIPGTRIQTATVKLPLMIL